jgi:hypothetical protein
MYYSSITHLLLIYYSCASQKALIKVQIRVPVIMLPVNANQGSGIFDNNVISVNLSHGEFVEPYFIISLIMNFIVPPIPTSSE